MVRFALLGCAAFGIALSAPACAVEALEDQASLAADEAAPAPRKVKRIRRKVAVLPPIRPAEASGSVAGEAAPERAGPTIAGSEHPLPTELQGAASSASVQASGTVVTVAALPPLRPSFPLEAMPPASAASEEARSGSTSNAPVPPARPDFVDVPAPALTVIAVLPPERPAFVTAPEPVRTGALRDPQPSFQPEPQPAQTEQPRSLFGALFGVTGQPVPAVPAEPLISTGRDFLDGRIAYHAKLNNVPAALVHRVVVRESRYNPRAVGRGGAMGLMQIKHATARGLGYEGSSVGLLDAETNLTYAVKYLAGAYRLADGSFDRAVQHYARGYYYEAKRRNSRAALRGRNERLQRQADATATVETAPAPAAPRSLFAPSR